MSSDFSNKVSVTQLIEPAIRFTKKMLFARPFSLKKWVKLAMVAWLAGEAFVGGGGGGCNFNFPGPSGGGGHRHGSFPSFGGFQPSEAWRYILEHIMVIIIFIAIIFAILITLSLIFAFLRAIFAFIFLNSLATTQVSVGTGFTQFQWHGWRLFFFRLIFGLIVFSVIILIIGVPAILLLSSFGGIEELKAAGWVTIFLVILGIIIVLLPIIILVNLFDSFTNNFVIPVMYLNHLGVIGAWKRYWKTLRVHVWDTVRFILMKFLLGLAGGIISIIVVLFTLIPFAIIGLIIGGASYLILSALHLVVGKMVLVIAAVVIAGLILLIPFSFVLICLLLPLAVFFRAYTLLFLSACDPELTVLKESRPESGPEYPWQVAANPII